MPILSDLVPRSRNAIFAAVSFWMPRECSRKMRRSVLRLMLLLRIAPRWIRGDLIGTHRLDRIPKYPVSDILQIGCVTKHYAMLCDHQHRLLHERLIKQFELSVDEMKIIAPQIYINQKLSFERLETDIVVEGVTLKNVIDIKTNVYKASLTAG